MATNIIYGEGGWCQNCSTEHDHPLNNILEIQEIPDEVTDVTA